MTIRPSSASIAICLLLAVTACSRQAETRPSRPEAETVSDGYDERSKQQAGGVSSVEYKPDTREKVTRVEELLIGKFPGVEVQRTEGDGYSVQIRGASSFMSKEQPLWVIDGVPVEVKSSRSLSWINPDDVQRIDVLKNPSETSIYGVRGGNGVIVVTTKRP